VRQEVSAIGRNETTKKSRLEKIEESITKKRLENFIKMLKIKGKVSNLQTIFLEIKKET
jgi:hypothetical protein